MSVIAGGIGISESWLPVKDRLLLSREGWRVCMMRWETCGLRCCWLMGERNSIRRVGKAGLLFLETYWDRVGVVGMDA